MSFEGLSELEINTITDLGNGEFIAGIRYILGKHVTSLHRTSQTEDDASRFINEHLELTFDETDRIKAKEVYKDYSEFSHNPIGKKYFYHILRSKGFAVRTGAKNINTVLKIKSHWV